MIRKSIILCVSLLALLLCAGAFAGGTASEASSNMNGSLNVHISGCIASFSGNFLCRATANGGSGSYNYWWQHTGNGQMYQTNSRDVTISGCTSGSFTLRVSVRDRVSGKVVLSPPHTVSCGDGGGGGIGFGR